MDGPHHYLTAEWRRLDILGRLALASRQGQEPPTHLLAELSAVQDEVAAMRANGSALAGLTGQPLSGLECDLVVSAVAPEAEPRLAWMFQSLQIGASQPYPTPALLLELLALDGALAGELYAALADGAPLRRAGLIEIDDGGPFQPLRPGRGVTARLLGRPLPDPMPPGATRVAVAPTWDDLVLPEDRVAVLRELLMWIRHRDTVFGAWQGRDCGGPVSLFCGPSGTGKTFAAAVIAAALGWPLYRVDLGRLVSKYIGETEQNLNRLFDAAHGRPMVLQFDEADALFGKRGEVREARDRYANLEVSHLLARVESHQGPCILTTNLRRNLDPAFARRFQVVVDFPRPDAEARALLWHRSLPPLAPRGGDLDLVFLGSAVNLTGGGIRNAALHAAFLAADGGRPIGLADVALAVWRELGKDGRDLSLADLGPLAPHLPAGALRC
jgi:ATPase family associated with various cellular activities (AAA)/Winged helix domain, variant